jgi:hypothetical protein
VSNEITNESNFISLIGNDLITVYGSKNHWIYEVPTPRLGLDKGLLVIGHASDSTSPSQGWHTSQGRRSGL